MSTKNKPHSPTRSRKRIQLQNLVDGSPFIVEGLENQFKCLYLVRAGDSTCKVQGYKVTDAGGYTPFSDFFSPATEVVPDRDRKVLSINKNGDLSIPKEFIPEKEKKETPTENKKKVKALKINNNMTTEQANQPKKGVGRPKKHKIELPKNKEFTVNNLASELGVKKFVVNNELNKIKRESPDSVQVVGTVPCGKGKPARVFKLI
jgi:hypothetical protein